MEYTKFIKEDYLKQVLKGKEVELKEDWERALVGFQVIAKLVARVSENALHFLEPIPDSFLENFSNGKTIEFNEENKKYLFYIIRAKNLLELAIPLSIRNLKTLHTIIDKEKEKIPGEFWVYYVAANKLEEEVCNGLLDQVKGIENSLEDCFPQNQKEIEEVKKQLEEKKAETKKDIKKVYARINEVLHLMLEEG
ncbi:MAG: hypothetical protein ACP5HJ_01715 [Candidatus Micrarchaeia archaeon]|jgi:hypothetical protein